MLILIKLHKSMNNFFYRTTPHHQQEMQYTCINFHTIFISLKLDQCILSLLCNEPSSLLFCQLLKNPHHIIFEKTTSTQQFPIPTRNSPYLPQFPLNFIHLKLDQCIFLSTLQQTIQFIVTSPLREPMSSNC